MITLAFLSKVPQIRAVLWRLGRRLYTLARFERSNDPRTNGEYWLLRQVAARAVPEAVFVDVGANVGDWTAEVCTVMPNSRAYRVYAYEPAEDTFAHVSARFERHGFVRTRRTALSHECGQAAFHVSGRNLGTNSLAPAKGATIEIVDSTTLDQIAADEHIQSLLFIKTDTEGHDFSVMRGAAKLLSAGQIMLWQFEYNACWIRDRAFLKDVYDFMSDKPYWIGKLFGDGIEIYERWHPELERYVETNYVLIRKDSTYESLCSFVSFNNANVPKSMTPSSASHGTATSAP